MIKICMSIFSVFFMFIFADLCFSETYLVKTSAITPKMTVQKTFKEIGWSKVSVSSISDVNVTSAVEPDSIVHTYSGANVKNTDDVKWWLKGPEFFGVNRDLANSVSRGQGVVVAVVDSGIDLRHKALQKSFWINKNEIPNNWRDDDKNGFIDDVYGADFTANYGHPSDSNGHGTHVSGIVLQLAPDVKIMALKFIGSNGSGSISDAIDAILYAVKNGAHVINASWGGSGSAQSLEAAIRYAGEKGVVFVAAAGNDNLNNDYSDSYPANYKLPNVISVASHREDGERSSFSNYGDSVHLSAPGEQIYSTYPRNSYRVLSGTSMAAPFVSAAAALIKSKNLQIAASDVKDALNPYPFTYKLDAFASIAGGLCE